MPNHWPEAPYVLAAALIGATGLAHSLLGERYLLRRLFRRDNLPHLLGGPDFTIGTLRFAWHLLTLAWWGLGALVWLSALPGFQPRQVAWVVSAVAGASALLPLWFTRGKHLSWVVLAVVAWLLLSVARA